MWKISSSKACTFWTWYRCRPCSFNVRCTTNCETPTSAASRRLLMSASKIYSSSCSIISILSRPRAWVCLQVLWFQRCCTTDVNVRSTIRGPTWRFRQPLLNWKNSHSLLKALTEDRTTTNWYMTDPISATLFWFLILVVLYHSFIE